MLLDGVGQDETGKSKIELGPTESFLDSITSLIQVAYIYMRSWEFWKNLEALLLIEVPFLLLLPWFLYL